MTPSFGLGLGMCPWHCKKIVPPVPACLMSEINASDGIPTGWTQKQGTWNTSNAQTSSADAILIYEAGDETNEQLLYVYPNNFVDKQIIVYNYVDNNNYDFFLIEWKGTFNDYCEITPYTRSGGTDSTRGETIVWDKPSAFPSTLWPIFAQYDGRVALYYEFYPGSGGAQCFDAPSSVNTKMGFGIRDNTGGATWQSAAKLYRIAPTRAIDPCPPLYLPCKFTYFSTPSAVLTDWADQEHINLISGTYTYPKWLSSGAKYVVDTPYYFDSNAKVAYEAELYIEAYDTDINSATWIKALLACDSTGSADIEVQLKLTLETGGPYNLIRANAYIYINGSLEDSGYLDVAYDYPWEWFVFGQAYLKVRLCIDSDTDEVSVQSITINGSQMTSRWLAGPYAITTPQEQFQGVEVGSHANSNTRAWGGVEGFYIDHQTWDAYSQGAADCDLCDVEAACSLCSGSIPTTASSTKAGLAAGGAGCTSLNGSDTLNYDSGCSWKKNHGVVTGLNGGNDVWEVFEILEDGAGTIFGRCTIDGVGVWEGIIDYGTDTDCTVINVTLTPVSLTGCIGSTSVTVVF